jgi:hypothetical protein
LNIVHEEPGHRLELAEAEGRFSLPALFIGLGLTALVAMPWRGLWAMLVHGAGRDSIDLVPSAIWIALGLSILLSAFGGHRLERLCADSGAGRVEWHRSHVLGLVRWTGRWPLASLDGFTLALASPPGRPPSRGALPLRLTLQRRRGQGSSERRLDLRIAGLDRTEKIADFALRLGAAAGLQFYRVTRNEGGRFAIDLRARGGPGFEAVPAVVGRSHYEADAVSRAATTAATTERLPAFDPATLRGSGRASVWEPGREVRIDRGWGLPVLLSPLLLAALLGPLAFLRLPSLQTMALLPRVAALGLITFAGLALALVGWFCLERGLPRHVWLDWTTGILRVDTVKGGRAIPFAEISGLELRHKSYSTGRSSGGMGRTSHWSQVRVCLRAPSLPSDELLVETRSFRNDTSSPREMVLPLARELASALHVDLRETGRS